MKRHSSPAESPRVSPSMRVGELRVSALLCLALGSCTVVDEALPVTWDFSFQCERDADRTEVIELQVGKGGCPISGPVVFEAVKSTWDSPASRPQGLPTGLYAFEATAWDADGNLIASQCKAVQIPMKQVIPLRLQGVSTCGGGNDADAGPDDSGIDEDAGGPSPDAGSIPDAGAMPDASSMPDAGAECPDDSDRDSDGVADCMDACPDDGAKTTDGDQDGDGTVNCVDECPIDANKTVPGSCGCNPKTSLGASEKLLVGEHLCGPVDDSVLLTMEADGNLHLTVDSVEVWASDSTVYYPPDPPMSPGQLGSQAKMQGDGNLVIRTVSDAAVWSSKTAYSIMGVTFLEVNANGTVTISREGSVIWTAGSSQ